MKKIILFVVLLIGVEAHAKKYGFGVTLEPIVGYERVQKLIPTPHTKDRLFYGARLTAGLLLIAAEGEFIRAEDTETFPTQSLTVKETSDKAKIGLRSTLRLCRMLYLFARAGVQASQLKQEKTENGVTTKTTGVIKWHPYGGAGVRVALGRQISLTGDLTVVFVNWPKVDKNEYQTSVGLTIHFP